MVSVPSVSAAGKASEELVIRADRIESKGMLLGLGSESSGIGVEDGYRSIPNIRHANGRIPTPRVREVGGAHGGFGDRDHSGIVAEGQRDWV